MSSPREAPAGAPTPSAHQVVLNHVEELIFEGKLSVGDRLPPERELAAQLGVSRAAAREAIRTLQAQGVLTSQVGSGSSAGTHVTAQRSQALGRLLRLQVALAMFPVDDVVVARIALERSSAELAALHRTDEDIETLRRLIRDMQDPHHDAASFNEFDTQFHVAIARMGANTFVSDLTEAIRESLRRPILTAERNLEDWPAFRNSLIVDHEGIADAIIERRPAEAVARVEEHIRRSYTILPMGRPLSDVASRRDD